MNLLIPHGFERNYVIGFVRGLAANGVNVTVVSDDEIAPGLSAAGIPHLNLRGSLDPARSRWAKLKNLFCYYIRLLLTIVRHRGATIHFNGLLISRIIVLDGIVLPLWIRCWAGCYVHTAHNALPHGREQSRFFRRAYHWIYCFPNRIVAHSPQVAVQLQSQFGVAADRIRVVTIGLNEEVPEPGLSGRECRGRLGLPSEGLIALFLGKVEPYKGVDRLIEAWSGLKTTGARLALVGWCGDAAYAARLRSAIEGSDRREQIQWRESYVTNEEMGLWLTACDVVVLPYRHIYQSGVIFVCLRFGVPVVATDVGSMAEFIDTQSGVITKSNDVAGIRGALDEFFARRDRFSREDIARRAQKYSWTRQCALIADLYA
jgi:glycosyltransferase involved in cell wall biosynthesis